MSAADQLEKLGKLLREGLLTREEFEQQKQLLLSTPVPGPTEEQDPTQVQDAAPVQESTPVQDSRSLTNAVSPERKNGSSGAKIEPTISPAPSATSQQARSEQVVSSTPNPPRTRQTHASGLQGILKRHIGGFDFFFGIAGLLLLLLYFVPITTETDEDYDYDYDSGEVEVEVEVETLTFDQLDDTEPTRKNIKKDNKVNLSQYHYKRYFSLLFSLSFACFHLRHASNSGERSGRCLDFDVLVELRRALISGHCGLGIRDQRPSATSGSR